MVAQLQLSEAVLLQLGRVEGGGGGLGVGLLGVCVHVYV